MVKVLHFTVSNGQLHIDNYTDAIALKLIDAPVARQSQAMTLHQFDLSFGHETLAEIARLDRAKNVLIVEGLWVSVFTRYFKCFFRRSFVVMLTAPPNMAFNLAPFGRWILRRKSAQRWLAQR